MSQARPQILLVRLDPWRIAFPIAQVARVVLPEVAQRLSLPSGPAPGLCLVGGMLHAWFDLAQLFGLPTPGDQALILTSIEGMPVALGTGRCLHVVEPPADSIATLPRGVLSPDRGFSSLTALERQPTGATLGTGATAAAAAAKTAVMDLASIGLLVDPTRLLTIHERNAARTILRSAAPALA